MGPAALLGYLHERRLLHAQTPHYRRIIVKGTLRTQIFWDDQHGRIAHAEDIILPKAWRPCEHTLGRVARTK